MRSASPRQPVEPEPEDDPWTRPGPWYVVHTQSGYEKKVTANLHARIQSMNMEDTIFEVVIPMEEVVEFKNGKKQNVQRKVFPGYILVRCHMSDESWYCIRNTPGVTGFVGQSDRGQKPTPLGRRDVRNFLSVKGGGSRRAGRTRQAEARLRGGRERARQGRPVRRLPRHDRRDQRRPHEAQGAGQHLRPRDPRRDGLQPGRQALTGRSPQPQREQQRPMAKKKVAAIVKIQIPAGKATPAPPVGTALGPHGIAIMDFVKAYNAATESQVGTVVPVEITVFEDRTFTFVLKTPPTPVLIREKAGIAKASSTPGKAPVATITEADVEEIAKIKMPDLNANDLEAAKQQVRGTARSMGIAVG